MAEGKALCIQGTAMTGYRDMSIAAGKFFGGLQQMGVTGEVHIARF